MFKIDQIRSLLLDHVRDFSFSPNVPKSLPDEPYDPRVGETYIEAVFQPNETLTPFVGDDDPKHHQGFLQVTVVGPRSSGSDESWQIVGALIEHFKKGTVLRGEDGINVKMIREPWATPPFPDEGWLRIPITVPYFCMA